MRVLFGLAALAAAVNGQTVTPSGPSSGNVNTLAPPTGVTALAQVSVYQSFQGGTPPTITPTGFLNTNTFINSNNFGLTVPFSVSTIVFTFDTNQYTGQMQYRWFPNYAPQNQYPSNGLSAASYTCDTCANGTPISCNTAVGPGFGASPAAGFRCASFQRVYTFSGLLSSSALATGGQNSFSVQVFDIQTAPAPNVSSYSFIVKREASPIVGDPQIYGLQGQDFQVHGMPDEIFNMISYPNLQVNARFVYLSEGACHDNFTACFAHPGTYISEEGIRLGKDKIHVEAGCYKKGLTVSVNGKKVTGAKTAVKLGSVHVESHRRVVIKTPIMAITISNSDKFLNQETELFDQKLLTLGSERRSLLIGESFHPEVPLHGLQGQTWRNVEYPSGLEYEGSISDYHVTDGNLFGSKFVFNQYKH